VSVELQIGDVGYEIGPNHAWRAFAIWAGGQGKQSLGDLAGELATDGATVARSLRERIDRSPPDSEDARAVADAILGFIADLAPGETVQVTT
jgi:hypothetical protein